MAEHWYFITHVECPLCGHCEEYRERRFGSRPAGYHQRHEFLDDACPEHFL